MAVSEYTGRMPYLLLLSLLFAAPPKSPEALFSAWRAECARNPEAAWLLATSGADVAGCLRSAPAYRHLLPVIEAERHLQLASPAKAEAVLAAAGRNPGSPWRWAMARAKRQLGKTDEAMGLIDRIADDYARGLASRDAWDLWAAGEAAVARRDWDTAEAVFDRLDQQHPSFVPGQIAGGEYDRVREYHTRALRRLSRAVAAAPWHPGALMALARAQLENPYAETSGEAVENARRALAAQPGAWQAHQLLAKVAIFDLHYPEALEYLRKADELAPDHPLTLAYRGAIALLHGRAEEYARYEEKAQKPAGNLEFYMELGRILNRHHRYGLAVEAFEKGLRLDPADPALAAWLGISLLRVGREGDGVYQLRRAAQADPDLVMAVNVSRLYDNVVFPGFVNVRQGHFLYRVGKDEWPWIAQVVPPVLEAAFARYQKAYGYTPPLPVRVELYRDPADFTTLIAGQPVDTGILGVCFGSVIVALSPSAGRANWAMVLSHELAHTFHVEMTQGRVPRWFTEGLAELETSRARFVWRREMSRDLYAALSEGSLRGIATLNEAFSHARNELEMVTAYIHATWVLRYLLIHHGYAGIRRMLDLYAKETPTVDAIREVTGMDAAAFDRAFFAYLRIMFRRYEGQFLPSSIRFADRARLEKDLEGKTAEAFGRMALFHLASDEPDEYRLVMEKARQVDPSNRWVRYAQVVEARRERDFARAVSLLAELAAAGHDGYDVRAELGQLHQAMGRMDDAVQQWERAARFDPEDASVRVRLALAYREAGRMEDFTRILKEVARINESDAQAARLLVERSSQERNFALAAEFGRQLLEIAPAGQGETLLLSARAHFEVGQVAAALPLLQVYRHENPQDRLGQVRFLLARSLAASGRRDEARALLGELVKLFPGMTEAAEELRRLSPPASSPSPR